MQCDLCPRFCKLREGQRGLCFVRGCLDGEVVLTTYGRSSGFCVDPIEKKPLNHFFPGTPVLSFGTAGCNLACRFCQNWDISKSRQFDTLADQAAPETIARAARELGCRSVAFTYNDPVIFHEYAIDVAQACHELDIQTVAVTAGEVCAEPREEFYRHMDAANVDLKAFTESFYREICGSHLQPVLDTLVYLRDETDVWFEITTLLIPGENDSPEEIDAMSRWVASELGRDVPMHFTAFHPDWKMMDRPPTPPQTLSGSSPDRHGQRSPIRLHWQRARPRRRQHLLPRVWRESHRPRLVRTERLATDGGRRVPRLRHPLPRTFLRRTRRLGSPPPPGPTQRIQVKALGLKRSGVPSDRSLGSGVEAADLWAAGSGWSLRSWGFGLNPIRLGSHCLTAQSVPGVRSGGLTGGASSSASQGPRKFSGDPA